MKTDPLAKQLLNEYHRSNRDESYFHPSEATRCSLEIWFRKLEGQGKLKSAGLPPSANLLLIFQFGHLMHDYIQRGFVEQGICGQEDIEKPIKDEERKITGSIDIFVPGPHPIYPGPRIVDIKTCSWNSFHKDRFPKYDHVVQTSIYAHYMGTKDISVYYVCKDGGKFDGWIEETGLEKAKLLGVDIESYDDPNRISSRTVHFKRDDQAVERAFKKFAWLDEKIKDRVPPEPEYDPRERYSPCLSCAYRYQCRDLTGRDHPDLD